MGNTMRKNEYVSAPRASDEFVMMDAFVKQCLHTSDETDWVPIEAVATAFSAFVCYEAVRASKPRQLLRDLNAGDLNSRYGFYTYGSQLYSVSSVLGLSGLDYQGKTYPSADFSATRNAEDSKCIFMWLTARAQIRST